MNRVRTTAISVVSCCLLLGLIAPRLAQGWSQQGHRLIALVAWSRLDEATRSKVISILKEHPRYERDFKSRMPNAIRNESIAEQERWIFARSAQWPDIARDTKYHRASWHYINEPLFLDKEDEEWLGGRLPVNLDRTWRRYSDVGKLNIAQAIDKSLYRLDRRSPVSNDTKALYLCWLAHLVGDIHQPLHTTALFTTGRFNGGDRGGNNINIRIAGGGSIRTLHNFWDHTADKHLTKDDTLEVVTDNLLALPGLVSAGNAAVSSMTIDGWIDEGYELSAETVYDPAILDAIRVIEYERNERLKAIKLPVSYNDKAEEIAQIRIVEAGYRLAVMIEDLFGE